MLIKNNIMSVNPQKLISTFVATIILVLLSVGIGFTIYLWLKGYTTSPIQETLPTLEQQHRCSQSIIKISNVRKISDNNIIVDVIYESGKEGLYDFIFEIISPESVAYIRTTDFTKDNPMQPGMIYSFNLILEKPMVNIERVRVNALCADIRIPSAEKVLK